jgi:hypothetical protein
LADREIDGFSAAMAQRLRSRRRMTTPAMAPIQRHLRDRCLAAGATVTVGGATPGNASTTVAVAADLESRGRAGATGTVLASGDANATVLSTAGASAPASAALSAITNASQLPHLAWGSLARPRIMTASTDRVIAALRELGAGGSRWTCAYISSSTPSPSNGIAPVSISYAIVASE